MDAISSQLRGNCSWTMQLREKLVTGVAVHGKVRKRFEVASWFLILALASGSIALGQGAKSPQSKGTKSRSSGNAALNAASSTPKQTPEKPQALRIWSDPSSANGQKPGDCYFRRVMDLPEVEKSFVEIETTSGSEVFFNGRRIRTIKPNAGKERIELQSLARQGKNCLAIRVLDRDNANPGVRVDYFFKPTKGNWRVVVSDSEWLATKLPSANWQTVAFNDQAWMPAIDVDATPMDSAIAAREKKREPEEVKVSARSSRSKEEAESATINIGSPASSENSAKETDGASEVRIVTASERQSKGVGKADSAPSINEVLKKRFTVVPGFSIEQVTDPSMGSLLAMTFNEFGHIIASIEGGGLVLLYDSNLDGMPDKTRPYCDLVGNVQGILPLNGDVYVTGEGEQGSGLYRLIDADRNGELEKAELLTKFDGIPGEHGAHQIAFGPDGFLYISMGNHVLVERAPDVQHSLAPPYEGDLVRPRFEDPGGHASGVKAPGGTVVRFDLNQRQLSIVAGGLRNAYDLAFHPNGSLYLHDSDMEADIGSVWHRPTGLFRIVEGGEYGWRSGWANWPDYYMDRLPSLADTGRGSPTGIAIYHHYQFPARYHRAIFTADWSEGRIIAMPIDSIEKGRVKAEDFVVGTPMNVTDLEVGPDGMLYFSTGGRGTEGGIYRIRWDGDVPESLRNLGEGISKAVRQPQLYSAFARQAVAVLKREMGDEWDDQILGVAFSEENPARYRMQALDLMQLLGPIPSAEMLTELSKTANEQVRSKCARLLGLHAADADGVDRLKRMTTDTSAMVRLAACESLVRIGAACEISQIESLLVSDVREDRYFGRRLLLNTPVETWRDKLLEGKPRTAIQASLALVAASPTAENGQRALDTLLKISQGFVSDAEFLDLLRAMQVALSQGNLDADAVPELKSFVEREFPTGNSTINGELVRLATHLECDLVPQCVEYLKLDVSMPDRMLIAMHLPLMPHEWTSPERMAVLQFLEGCLKEKSGGSYPLYVMQTSEALSKHLTEREALQILELGQKYPNAALSALFKIPSTLSAEQIELVKKLDASVDKGGLEEDVYKRLKTGITAILSQQESEAAIEYLRQRWRKSPDRRASIALALAQRPHEDNWDYLVRSMGVLDLFAVPDVCNALMKIDAATEDPEAIRQTILQGCRLVDANQNPAPTLRLLEYWTGQKPTITPDAQSTEAGSPMAAWQTWYAEQFPNAPPAVLPTETEQPRWSLEFLDQFLSGEQGREGSSQAGAAVYAKARCSACHKMESQGGGFGPDLTSINRRFTRTEVLESILFPSHVISDQYATKKVITKNGEIYTGVVVKTSKGIAVRVNENKEFMISDEEIEELAPSKVSAMPAGLLDELSPTEIRDLMCYLGYVPEDKRTADQPTTFRR